MVSEANIATPTTRIVPIANEMKVALPVINRPAIATITVSPEIRIALPEVAGCGRERFLLALARGTFLPFPSQVEQRVVDADRKPDQQDHRSQGFVDREYLARQSDQTDRRRHRRDSQQQGHSSRHE